MHPFFPYAALTAAIICEVTGSTFMAKSEQFTRPIPTLLMALFFGMSFYCLTQALRVIPLGITYAIWVGCGIVLTAIVGVVVLRQALDVAAIIGIGLIVSGVVVMQVFSTSSGH